MRLRRQTILLGAVLALIAASSSVGRSNDKTNPAIEAITLFEKDKLKACGVRATFAGDQAGSFDLLLIRTSEDRGTEWAVKFASANSQAVDGIKVSLNAVGLDTAVALKPVPTSVPNTIESRGSLNEADGTKLIVGLMTSGGTFTLSGNAGTDRTFSVNGPLSHDVRRGYLTCAGDLFRP